MPRFQLYNLTNDPSEEKNLYNENHEKVKVLKELLASYINRGRSTPGIPQTNESMDDWQQIDWSKQ